LKGNQKGQAEEGTYHSLPVKYGSPVEILLRTYEDADATAASRWFFSSPWPNNFFEALLTLFPTLSLPVPFMKLFLTSGCKILFFNYLVFKSS